MKVQPDTEPFYAFSPCVSPRFDCILLQKTLIFGDRLCISAA